MKISELKPGAGFEIKAKIISVQPLRKLWKCFSCNERGIWTKPEDFREVCPSCNSNQSDKPNTGVWIQNVTSAVIDDGSGKAYLDLWKDDIGKFNEGNTIRLINGFCKKIGNSDLNVSKGKYGRLEIVTK